MKVTELVLQYGEMVRTGDFANRNCKLEVRVTLEAGDDAKRVADTMMSKIKEKVRASLNAEPEE
jgi:hypothetical protein